MTRSVWSARLASSIDSALPLAPAPGSTSSRAAIPSADVAGRHDADGPIGHLGGLARRQLHVRVVRQDHDLLARRGGDRGQELAGAGVLGLPAPHDRDVEPLVGDPEGGERLGEAVAGRDGDDPEGHPEAAGLDPRARCP